MNPQSNYIKVNKDLWNARTEVHLTSEFYNVNEFIKGKSSLNDIELNLLGDVKGKSILHLQCHFGQDSISLARLGATVTGVDLSENAIAHATTLAQTTNQQLTFICCDVYDLPIHLNEQFDIVYTSYGTIGWLPDMDKWASIVSRFLKPQGKFVFVEFHPVVWMFDNDFKTIQYSYFKKEAIVETENGTYADKNAPIQHESITWNHGMSEVLNALLNQKLVVDVVNEYDYSPYNCFNETVEITSNKFQIKGMEGKIPMVYAIVASKI